MVHTYWGLLFLEFGHFVIQWGRAGYTRGRLVKSDYQRCRTHNAHSHNPKVVQRFAVSTVIILMYFGGGESLCGRFIAVQFKDLKGFRVTCNSLQRGLREQPALNYLKRAIQAIDSATLRIFDLWYDGSEASALPSIHV